MSDVDTYPILKVMNSQYTHFPNFPKMLENVVLPNDTLVAIQHFYDSIHTAFMTTLKTNNFLPDYENIPSNFDPESHLVPDSDHTQYDDASNSYKNMSKTLLHYLKRQQTGSWFRFLSR